MSVRVEVSRTIDANVSGAVRRAQRSRLEDAMNKGFAVSQHEVREDRGKLRQTAFPPEWRGNKIAYGYTQPYAKPIEEGTDPFQPPIQPLLEWSRRVSGDTGLGWYVATVKIPEEGVTAHPYAEPGADAAAQWLVSNPFGDYLDDEL